MYFFNGRLTLLKRLFSLEMISRQNFHQSIFNLEKNNNNKPGRKNIDKLKNFSFINLNSKNKILSLVKDTSSNDPSIELQQVRKTKLVKAAEPLNLSNLEPQLIKKTNLSKADTSSETNIQTLVTTSNESAVDKLAKLLNFQESEVNFFEPVEMIHKNTNKNKSDLVKNWEKREKYIRDEKIKESLNKKQISNFTKPVDIDNRFVVIFFLINH